MNKFLSFQGLTTFLNELEQKFATEAEVAQVEADTDEYVLNIDYESTLAFDVKQIISGSAAASPILDVGLLDQMILA